MRILTVDKNNDLVIENGRLSFSTDREAVSQACEHAVKAQYGEMILAIQRGIPYNLLAWNGQPNLIQLEAYLRRAILAIDKVFNIAEFEISASNNIVTYNITINTLYGIITLDDLRISREDYREIIISVNKYLNGSSFLNGVFYLDGLTR